jgi:alpha-tubulin suppressor-like RCC1 family protein
MRLALVLAITCSVPLVAAPDLTDDVRVASSSTHTLVIAPDGTVMCQGSNQFRLCGAEQDIKFVDKLTPIPGLPKGRAVVVPDAWISMVLGEDGRVYVWGRNDFGLLGGTDRGPAHERLEPWPVPVLQGVVGIAGFVQAGAALLQDGTVWMWGEDRQGLLATGTLLRSGEYGKPQYTPQRVQGIAEVVQITGGDGHMLALKSDGTVWTWGVNKYGQLGLGDQQGRARPTRIQSLTGVTRIFASGSTSAARQTNGSWLWWGSSPAANPVDDGPVLLNPSPLPGPLRDTVDLSDGIAAFADGTVRTWGLNSFGSLGTGGSVDAYSSRGELVRSLSSIVRVWAGGARAFALKSDGTLYMWGPSGSQSASIYRVPKVIATFPMAAPRKQ